MPNHVTNRLRITGPKEDVRRLADFVRSDAECWVYGENAKKSPCPFDFDRIVPETEDVKRSLRDSSYFPDGYLANWKPRFVGDRPAEYWYEWHLENWGTKWNGYDYSLDEPGDNGLFVVWFDTAWSAPEPVVRRLAELFPLVHIDHRYADEDIGRNCGIVKYRHINGKLKVSETDMEGRKRWCRSVNDRRIGND